MTHPNDYERLDGTLYSHSVRKKTLTDTILDTLARLLRNKIVFGCFLFVLLSILILIFVGPNVLAFVFVLLCIGSFLVTRAFPLVGSEFGLSATIILSSLQGWEVGFLVGKIGNIIGQLVTFQLDIDSLYDLMFLPIAIIASFFPIDMISTIGIFLVLAYSLGYFIYLKFVDGFDFQYITYGATNMIFNLIIMWKIVPLFAGIGF